LRQCIVWLVLKSNARPGPGDTVSFKSWLITNTGRAAYVRASSFPAPSYNPTHYYRAASRRNVICHYSAQWRIGPSSPTRRSHLLDIESETDASPGRETHRIDNPPTLPRTPTVHPKKRIKAQGLDFRNRRPLLAFQRCHLSSSTYIHC